MLLAFVKNAFIWFVLPMQTLTRSPKAHTHEWLLYQKQHLSSPVNKEVFDLLSVVGLPLTEEEVHNLVAEFNLIDEAIEYYYDMKSAMPVFSSDSVSNRMNSVFDRAHQLESELKQLNARYEELEDTNCSLRKEIEELKKRPVTVVSSPSPAKSAKAFCICEDKNEVFEIENNHTMNLLYWKEACNTNSYVPNVDKTRMTLDDITYNVAKVFEKPEVLKLEQVGREKLSSSSSSSSRSLVVEMPVDLKEESDTFSTDLFPDVPDHEVIVPVPVSPSTSFKDTTKVTMNDKKRGEYLNYPSNNATRHRNNTVETDIIVEEEEIWNSVTAGNSQINGGMKHTQKESMGTFRKLALRFWKDKGGI